MRASCLLDPPVSVAAIARDQFTSISGVFRVRLASEPWELRGYSRLRHNVFCEEQRMFRDTDRDEHDSAAFPIVAVSYAAGMADEVVGAVRIYETSAGIWYGSRLAVAPEWRGVHGLAAGLIRAAVCNARGRGCDTFLATVQRQNVPLFRRLHWRSLGELTLHDRSHHLMSADLAHYPPLETFRSAQFAGTSSGMAS